MKRVKINKVKAAAMGLTAVALLGACNGQNNTAGDTDGETVAIESPDAPAEGAASASPEAESPGASPATGGEENTVRIQTFAYVPKTAEVEVGTPITFVNDDDILHTFTSGKAKKQGIPGVSEDVPAEPDGLFDEDVDLDESFEFTFEKPGKYPYYCDIHSGMSGVVVAR